MCLFPTSGGLEMTASPGGEVDKWRRAMLTSCAVHAAVGVLNLITGNVWDGKRPEFKEFCRLRLNPTTRLV